MSAELLYPKTDFSLVSSDTTQTPPVKHSIVAISKYQCGIDLRSPIYSFKQRRFTFQKFYTPKIGDHVIAIVTNKNNEYFTLDINCGFRATIDTVDGFPGATKQNIPNIKERDAIFCQIYQTFPAQALPTKVTCIDASCTKSWTTFETYFGQLIGGIVIKVDIYMCYSLAAKPCHLLNNLSKLYKFEIAVGLNGRVWVKTDRVEDLVNIINAILGNSGSRLSFPHE